MSTASSPTGTIGSFGDFIMPGDLVPFCCPAETEHICSEKKLAKQHDKYIACIKGDNSNQVGIHCYLHIHMQDAGCVLYLNRAHPSEAETQST